MIRLLRNCLLSIAFLLGAASAQSMLAAQYPAGLPLAAETGFSQSMGGTGVGVRGEFLGMTGNVANLGTITRSSFSTVLSSQVMRITEGDAVTDHVTVSPRLFSFAFPIPVVGTFGFSFDRRYGTDISYRAEETRGLGIDSLVYSLVGGLSSWQLGWGHVIGSFGSLGIAYERLYLSRREIVTYGTSIGDAIPRYDSTRILLGTNGLRMGMLLSFEKLTIGIGGSYSFPGTAMLSEGSTEGTTSEEEFDITLPPSIGIGASYQLTPGFLAAADLSVTMWDRCESAHSLGGAVEDAWALSGGVEFIPAPNMLVPKYWETMHYRLGLRYTRMPVPTAREYSFTLGVGLPLFSGNGLFDFIVESGMRSDDRYSDYSERFVRIALGLNGARKWFQTTGTRY